MCILAFDIGGSSVKYGIWVNEQLVQQDSFSLPADWSLMKIALKQVFDRIQSERQITGVALSAPGLVDEAKGKIRGVSAVPYLHHFPIQKELTELFNVPVSMENDANCAALAEVWLGAASDVANSIFFVIGTGIGGAIVINRKLVKGRNLFGGEFGYMVLNESSSLSDLGSSVKCVKKYNQLTGANIDGQELFELAETGDELASHLLNKFYASVARGIYNLLVCFDPGRIVIGGGVSGNSQLIPMVDRQLKRILLENAVTELTYEIVACQFGNDANLIGAVYHFIENHPK
ncbi:hypothetical protein ATZ33_10740 [Enterococcus silesiacus]|uniref:ROK family protein n=1 Tax=Enterococcus silesiacus TaxID=332949 RepID=A0A0S3KC14_9ENTE|nr:ROK family protein [Enterococcus silesiacus]ALS01835.1 hypothetical protein ATZ33_10740 [Enterococcus silesiacus]OJG92095.1 ROK family protein [Enterococcus silesiacus]